MPTFRKLLTVLSLAMFLAVTLPGSAQANDAGTETGDELAVTFDLLILRPVGVVATGAGLVIFVGSLPISLATLSVGKAFSALVVGPARYTFMRPLGDENIVP